MLSFAPLAVSRSARRGAPLRGCAALLRSAPFSLVLPLHDASAVVTKSVFGFLLKSALRSARALHASLHFATAPRLRRSASRGSLRRGVFLSISTDTGISSILLSF